MELPRNFTTYDNELEGKALVDEIHEKEPTVPVISHSQLKSWDRCEFKWYLGYVEGWTPREKSDALTLGTLIHECAAVWYRSKGSEATVKQLYADHYTKYAYESGNMAVLAEEMWLFDNYMEWSIMQDRSFDVEAVEEHFIIKLHTPLGRPYYLQGYVDVRGTDTSNHGKRWLWDHKSSTRFWTMTEFDMDAQLPLYAAAYDLYGMEIFGVLLNQMNTYRYVKKENVPPEKLFKRDYNYLTPTQKMNLLAEVGYAVDDMIDRTALLSSHSLVESLDGSLYGSLTIPRRRMSRDCSFCPYREPCLLGLKGHNIEAALEVDFVRKNTPQPVVKEELEIKLDMTYMSGDEYRASKEGQQ